ncbi:MAG: DJ-1/PfpI family protein [Niameybacter sp.]|uniref:DJ-1/PfpI family protein n=1 Tax=Niameybacter sp. TaxID=2033640 RepID=UPI002FCAD4DE
MQKTLCIYVLDTMADWEIGYFLQAMSMQTMLSKNTPKYTIKTVGQTKNPIKTLGGLTLTPDWSLEELDDQEVVALLLPGANTWQDTTQKSILDRASTCIEQGILVAAICGATLALADLGVLNHRLHTSNDLAYLDYFSTPYTGHNLYQNVPSVVDSSIITASSAGGLLWAKHILAYLNVYSPLTLEAWYQYYLTGDPKYYTALLSSVK